MNGFLGDVEKLTLQNNFFRQVLYTSKNAQLVLMSIDPGQEIGQEVHHLDQFIKCEQGSGKAILDGVERDFSKGFAVLVPAGATHNIINTSSSEKMKLYTVYSPPNHKDGVVHKTKSEAEADSEHFDGKTSE